MTKPPPCDCDRLTFPHRREWRCEDFEQENPGDVMDGGEETWKQIQQDEARAANKGAYQ